MVLVASGDEDGAVADREGVDVYDPVVDDQTGRQIFPGAGVQADVQDGADVLGQRGDQAGELGADCSDPADMRRRVGRRGSRPMMKANDFPVVTAPRMSTVRDLDAAVATRRACLRLVAWREAAGRVKRRAFRGWEYWARPVPGFGSPDGPLAIIGLAPAAHGGNRTGRIFTGDPSGDALYAALYDIGLASQPTATHRDDGMELYGVRITVPVHCAPPVNRPTTTERDTCRPWLARELELLQLTLRVIAVLGAFAWQALLPVLAGSGWHLP
ncbi:hypothetical protein GCM10010341_60330 [Streptomyces noursei]|nr:hypothetical protein GCM10010341_60330 [Streptomyces noursei]